MLFVLEALKEAGARTPGAMGQTMSIVGGLVLGDAAVSARFAAAPTVIVVAIAGVTGLMVPKLQTAALWLRFVLLAAAASWGLYGVGLALGLTLAAPVSYTHLFDSLTTLRKQGGFVIPWNNKLQ